jgi:hypothetical protein
VARLATPSQGVRQIAGPLTEGPGPTSRPGSLPAPRVACRYSPVGFDRQQSDTLIIQRNTIIEFLQEQVHDLTLELDDAITHINVLQEQPVPLDVPEELESEDEEEDPKEIEGVSDLDSEHGDLEPNPQPNRSSSGSQSSVGNLDDF